MSESHEAGAADDLDLSDVPMDEPELEEADAAEGEGEGEEGEKKPAAAAREALAPEELTKRFNQTKTALAAERGRRRETDRQLRELQARLDGGTAAPRQEQQRRAEPEAEIDPETDPLGALKQMKAKIAAYESAAALDERTEAQQQAREAQITRVEEAFQEHEADFREDNPDYDDAAKHYAISRAQELMKFGIDPAKVQPMLREEFASLAATAIRGRKNPAAVVYELAKGRGFGTQGKGDPIDPKLAAKGAAAGKLDALERGQRATSPLSRGGGRTPTGLDAATVGNINIRSREGKDAFEKAFDMLERQAKARA
jgi:hypothetical protein